MTPTTPLLIMSLLAGLAGIHAAPVLIKADSLPPPMQAAPTDVSEVPPAPSPTGWPPGPSIKTITHSSTSAPAPQAEGTQTAQSRADGQALAVGPPSSFTHAVTAPDSPTYGTSALANSKSGDNKDGQAVLSTPVLGYDQTLSLEEEEDCEDEDEEHPMPASGSASPAEAQGVIAAPPVPKSPGSNETIPLTPSPVHPEGGQTADPATSSQPSGMDNFMNAGARSGKGETSTVADGLGPRRLLMRDMRRSRQV